MSSVWMVRSGAILCLVWLTIAVEVEVDPAWENIFRTRSDQDWREVWHTERHRRCYHDLLVHMDWVCQKDIYSVRRRKRKAPSDLRTRAIGRQDQQQEQAAEETEEWFPFVELDQANSFLGRLPPTRRRRGEGAHTLSKRGIIDECCHASTGCSWEEYAEYCPANSRRRP